jgi:amino acid permease
LSIIASIPNFLFAFCFQLNYFPIFKGLKNSTDAKMKKVSFIGILCCYLLFVLIGFIGYRTYGNDITANFLLSIKHENTNVVLFYILNLSFGLSVIFSFPIIFFAARNCFIGLIKLFNFK